ncbi:DoxX family protein [Tistrella sp. BH-R2-4]|uniref:DoxX family protein n=2 Tax=Geminicoccaceae TaxID=2066434 RepID=A0ABU9YLE9_9PROT
MARPVAFLLSGLMAFAYVIVHSPQGFCPVLNHGEAAMLYCFFFLYIAAAGPGSLSIDAWVERGHEPAPAESR